VRPRGRSRPSSSTSSRPRPEPAALAALLVALGCASARPPAPAVAEKASGALTWLGSLSVSVSGKDLRGRSRALIAFRRPDSMRLEIPGPTGARLVAVARAGRLTAVLPGERARLESAASARDFEALVGVPLAPGELMDLLLGSAPRGARRYEADWGEALPRRVRAELADGTRLDARVDEAEAGVELPAAAFDAPRCDGCRAIDADEARRLLTAR
jgi:hypothetical protein